MTEVSDYAGLIGRLRQYEGKSFETTACYNGTRDEAADAIEALTAALAVAPKPRVRNLEWAPFGDGMFTAKAPPIGTYAMEDGYLPLKLNGHTIGRYESVAEAKAAAQADYEARILAALEDRDHDRSE